MKYINDESLVLGTVDGIEDLSLNKYSLSVSNCIVGRGINFTNGSLSWQSLTPISYVYVFTAPNGSKVHYAFNGTLYTNGVEGGVQPLNITSTGISGVTGYLSTLKIYSSVKSADWIKLDYANESKYW